MDNNDDNFKCPACGFTKSRNEICASGPHYGKLVCLSCGRFVRWLRTPTETRRAILAVSDLLACPDCGNTEGFCVAVNKFGSPDCVCGICGWFVARVPEQRQKLMTIAPNIEEEKKNFADPFRRLT